MLDTDRLDKLLDKYPKLSLILRSGVISMKMTRRLLDLDKWLMEDLYAELLESRAVKGVSSGTFRATPTTIAYLEELDGFKEADDDEYGD